MHKTSATEISIKDKLNYALYNCHPPLLILMLYTLMFILTMCLGNSIPIGTDTFGVYMGFHNNYRDYFLSGFLPEWNPYCTYGIPSYLFETIYFSPITYLVFVIGKIFYIKYTYYLFLFNLWLEGLVLIFGLFSLLRLFLKHKTSFYVAITSLALTVPQAANFQHNFRSVVFVPLVLYFIAKFFISKRWFFLLIAVSLSMGCGFGMPQYWLPVYMYIFLMVFIFTIIFHLILNRRVHLLEFIKSFNAEKKLNIFTSIFVMLLAAMFVYIMCSELKYITFGSFFADRGRDLKTLKVPLDNFLTFGGDGLYEVPESFLGGIPNFREAQGHTLFFLTTTALFFLIYSLLTFVTLRKYIFYLVALMMFFLFLFLSWGPRTPLAKVMYHFPVFGWFRHLNALASFAKLFGVILAGIGADIFLDKTTTGNNEQNRLFFKKIAVFTGILCLATSLMMVRWYYRYTNGNITGLRAIMILMHICSLLLFTFIVTRIKPRTFLFFAIAVILIQSSLYMINLRCAISSYPGAISLHGDRLYVYKTPSIVERKKVSKVCPLVFEETRTDPINHRNIEIAKAVGSFPGLGLESERFFNMDQYVPSREDIIMPGVAALRKMQYEQFNRVIGYGNSKLQLVEDYTEVALNIDKEEVLADNIRRYGVVLEDNKGKAVALKRTTGDYPNAPSLFSQGIKVKDFTSNILEVSLISHNPNGSWLLYADAYHPYWRVYIDGLPAALWKNDMAFKAVKVPCGYHMVRFEFGQWYGRLIYWSFVLITGLTMLLSIFMSLYYDCAFRKEANGSSGYIT